MDKTYDRWFRSKVKEAINNKTGKKISHNEAMKTFRNRLNK